MVLHREISLSEIFVMPSVRHTALFMFGLGFWKQKRAESFGGSCSRAETSGLLARVPKAYEAGISIPPEIMGGATQVLSMLYPFKEFSESKYRSIFKSRYYLEITRYLNVQY